MAVTAVRPPVFVRFKKLKGMGCVLAAARHNLRELPLTPNITAAKQGANQILCGELTATAVNAAYKAMLIAAGIGKLRVDAVRLIECVISLPAGKSDVDDQYFTAAIAWVRQTFGHDNILSAVIHNDESAQHMHVLVVPLINGRMRGSDLLGGPHHIGALLRSFEQAMQPASKHLGLETRHSVPTEQMARDTVAYLQRIGDPMWQSALAPIIRACIEDNPEPFYQMLGCPTTATEALGGAKNDWSSPPPTKRLHRAKRVSTMAQIFTRPVRNMRGATAERYRQSAEYLQTLQASPLRRDVSAVAQSAAVATHDLEAELLRSPVEAAAVARDMPTQTLCSVGFALHGPISKRLHAQTRCIARRAAAGSPTCTSAVPTPRQGQIFESPRSACPEATRRAQCVSCNDQATHQSQVHIAWRWPPTRAPCNVDPPHFQLCQRRVSTLADNTRMANYEALTTLDNPVHGCSVTSLCHDR